MFRHYWPQEDICDHCHQAKAGAMLYYGDEPVSFVCHTCNPVARKVAENFSHNVSDHIELNGWNWYSETETLAE